MYAYLQAINKTIYCLKAVCLYIALEDIIDLLNFYNSFDGNFNDASDKESSTLSILGIPLFVNPYLSQNPFIAQHIDQDTDLDTDSITNFNAMQSSVPLKSDTYNS